MRIDIFIFCIIASCTSVKNICSKDSMSQGKFNYLNSDAQSKSYFIVQGSKHEEYLNGELYSTSKIEWSNCEEYNIIIQKANYPDDGGLYVGDTLHVKITSVIKDTFTCSATALNFAVEIRFMRVK